MAHRTQQALAETAQKQYETQMRKVDRLKQKRKALMAQVAKINEDLLPEEEMLAYYAEHPMVKPYEGPQDAPVHQGHDFVEQELPIENPKVDTWKGFKEKHLAEK